MAASAADLLLILGVGIGVIDDDCVSSLQIEASSSRPDGQQEYERRAVGTVEFLDIRFPAQSGSASIAAERYVRRDMWDMCE